MRASIGILRIRYQSRVYGVFLFVADIESFRRTCASRANRGIQRISSYTGYLGFLLYAINLPKGFKIESVLDTLHYFMSVDSHELNAKHRYSFKINALTIFMTKLPGRETSGY